MIFRRFCFFREVSLECRGFVVFERRGMDKVPLILP